MPVTRCFYYEDGKCIGSGNNCEKKCGYFVERRSLTFGVIACIIIGAILYMAGFVTYGIGRYNGTQQVSRTACMQYMAESNGDGTYTYYRWKK